MEDFLTVEEVAQKLHMHPDTVARLLRKGEIPGHKIGGQWRVVPSELMQHLEKQRELKSQDKEAE